MSLAREIRSCVSILILTLIVLGTGSWIADLPSIWIVANAQAFSGDVTINSDGSISPANAPVTTTDNVTYTLTGDINGSLTVFRDNIVIEGSGYKIANGTNTVVLNGVSNITIRNVVLAGAGSNAVLIDQGANMITLENITIYNSSLGARVDRGSFNVVFDNVEIRNVSTGISIDNGSFNVTIVNVEIRNVNYNGIFVDDGSFNITIANTNISNIFSDYGSAIEIQFRSYNVTITNTTINNGFGRSAIMIDIYESITNVRISNVEINNVSSGFGIRVYSGSNIKLDNIRSNGSIYIDTSQNIEIYNIEVFGGRYNGIELDESSDIDIVNATSYNNDGPGLDIYLSSNVRISNIKVYGNKDYGIYMTDYYNINISSIEAYNNSNAGIGINDGSRVNITNIYVSNNKEFGIILDRSRNINISDARLENNGVYIESRRVYDLSFRNFTVNGKPIAYIEDDSGKTISGDYAQVILVRASSIEVRDVYISGSVEIGVQVFSSDNITFRNVTIDSTKYRGMDIRYRNSNISIMDSVIRNVRGEGGIHITLTGGIYIYDTDNITISRSIISNNSYGIYQDWDTSLAIMDSEIKNNTYGVYISFLRVYASIDRSTISTNMYGVFSYGSEEFNLTNTQIINNSWGVITSAKSIIVRNNIFTNNSLIINSENVPAKHVVENNTVNGKPILYIEDSTGQVISGNYGEIIVVNSSNIVVQGIQISTSIEVYVQFHGVWNSTIRDLDIDGAGLYLDVSSNISIANNTIKNAKLSGIYMNIYLSNITVEGNRIESSREYGITIEHFTSENITIRNNYIADNRLFGIRAWSDRTVIENNVFVNDGVFVISTGNSVSNNTVNGKPLLYLEQVSNRYISGSYGQIILVNVTNITVDSQIISSSDVGIEVFKSSNVTISNSTIQEGSVYGIYVRDASNLLIEGNLISESSSGLYIFRSSNINVTRNTFWRNDIGIYIGGAPSSSSIYVFHNNFLDSVKKQAITDGAQYNWDAGYPSGGNFWSDLQCVDSFSGPNQDQPGSDGICDSPYVIDDDNRDRYPLANRVQNAPVPIVNPVYGFTVDPVASYLTNVSGSQVTHTFTLVNTGNVSDSYTLSITSGTGTLSLSSVNLAPNQSAVFTLTVTAGSPGTVATTEIKIVSQGSGTETVIKAVTAAVSASQANSTVVSSGTSPPQQVLPNTTVQVVNATKPVKVELFNLSNVNPTGTPPPPGVVRVGAVVDVVVNSSDFSYIWINISYAGADLSGIDESTLKLYKWNATSSRWEPFRDTGVDVSRKIVWARAYPDELRGVPVILGGSSPPAPPALVGGTLEIPDPTGFEEDSLTTTIAAAAALAALALAGYVAYTQYRRRH